MRSLAPPLTLSAAFLCACGSGSIAGSGASDASPDGTLPSNDSGVGDDDSSSAPDVLSITPPPDDADLPPSPEAGPGGPWVAFTSTRAGSFDLFLVHPDGTGLRPLVQTAGADLHPAWSPDGARLVFTSTQSGASLLYAVDVATNAITPLATGLASASTGSYSPDGGDLTFGGAADGGALIYRVPSTGGVSTPLTTDATMRDNAPVWSPNGKTIYFASDRSGQFEVWSVAPDGTGLTQITTSSNILGGPAITPDGASLLFARTGGAEDTQVVLYPLLTQVPTVLSSQGDSSPAMSPARDRLAVTSTRYGVSNPEIVLMDLDAGNPFRLTNDPGIDDEAVFQPLR